MCGRFTLTCPDPIFISERFHALNAAFEWKEARYNLAPSQNALTVAMIDGHPQLMPMKWGFIPKWNPDAKPVINARSESLSEKPYFRESYRKRRCLVVADGFYEWRDRLPYRITLKNDQLFAFGGVWDIAKDDQPTFAIITVPANSLMSQLHDRMPLILSPGDELRWINPSDDPISLMKPYPAEEMKLYRVSPLVNSWANEKPECIYPIEG